MSLNCKFDSIVWLGISTRLKARRCNAGRTERLKISKKSGRLKPLKWNTILAH